MRNEKAEMERPVLQLLLETATGKNWKTRIFREARIRDREFTEKENRVTRRLYLAGMEALCTEARSIAIRFCFWQVRHSSRIA